VYVESGYVECGYTFDGEYVADGYVASGYILDESYVASGYVASGYVQGDCASVTLSDVDVSFALLYLFFKSQTLKEERASYLYDNQTSLEPLRIVREKIS
jgi:hypothetical protein